MPRLTSPLRASSWEWVQAVLLAANLIWTTLCLGGFRAETMVVTTILTAVLMLAHGAGLALGGKPASVHPAGWYFVPFLAYAAANVEWVSPVRWLAWMDWLGWLQAFAVFWVGLSLRRHTVRAFLWTTLLSLGVGLVVLGAYQRFVAPDWLMLHRIQADQYVGRASGSFGIPNSMAAWLILVIPTAGALAVRPGAAAIARVFFGWLTLVLLFGLILTISRGAWIGFALALIVWPMLGSKRSWRTRARWAALVLAGLAAIGTATWLVSGRVRERLTQLVHESGERSRPILWRAAGRMVLTHPVVGTGGGSFNAEFERFRPEGFLNEPLWAHNDYLNTLSDYGATGGGLLFGALAALVLAARHRQRGPASAALEPSVRRPGLRPRLRRSDVFDEPLVRQAHAIGLLAFGLQLAVDFHLKIPALAMAAALVGALTVSGGGCRADSVAPPGGASAGGPGNRAFIADIHRFVGVGWLLVAAIILLKFVPLYRAEARREMARDAIDAIANGGGTERARDRIERARRELAEAVALAPQDARAWADKAYAAAQWSRLEPDEGVQLGREAEADADRAIQLAPGIAEFWIRRGVARDLQGRWELAGDDFTHAISLAPKIPLPWYHYAYHLALRPTGLDLAPAMVEICLRLDPQNPEGLRLRHQLATSQARP